MEELAKVRARLRFFRVGPEEEGEVFARLRCASVQHEVGQEGSQPVRVYRRDHLTVAGDSHFAQQLNT